MYIIGISAYYHDSAVALIREGRVISAIQEERLSRIKNDARFPGQALKYLLENYEIKLEQIDAIVFYDKPWLKFERIIESCIRFAPRSWQLFVKSMPIWLSQKLNFRKLLKKELNQVMPELGKKEIYFSEHHLSHIASSVYTAPFVDCIAISLDGVGEWATLSIYEHKKDQLIKLKEMHYPDSIGLLYSAFTVFCGFKVNSGEYKLMGLAPYGDPQDPQTQRFCKLIKNQLLKIFPDGSIQLNLDYFAFQYGAKTIEEKKWSKLFSLNRRGPNAPLTQDYCNFALAAQQVTEEIILKIVQHASTLSSSRNLCLSGGVALNCVANAKINQLNLFDQIWIHPAPGDAGGALGAALAFYYANKSYGPVDFSPYLGPKYSEQAIKKTLDQFELKYTQLNWPELLELVAKKLQAGQIIGWLQDEMEWGPRALGNRSILANALDANMQKKLNLKIKFRESFRPFAPIVTVENAKQYFEIDADASFMQYTFQVKAVVTKGHPQLASGMSNIISPLPAVTHADGSARTQTVSEKQNPKIYQLLKTFEKLTGTPVLINTSFNQRGEPIVCTPQDAIECFLGTELDVLVLQNFVLFKHDVSAEMLRLRNFELD